MGLPPEIARKSIHMAVGLGTFALVFLGPLLSALGALGLVLFNLFVLPRFGGRRLWRPSEKERGWSVGMAAYPLAVLGLILVFWKRLEVAAAIWAVLAFGDGAATLVGSQMKGSARGGLALPWNPVKSWAGSLACWLFGALGCWAALAWTLTHQGKEIAPAFLVAVSVSTGLVAAWIESLPLGVDDNLSVPLLSAVFLAGVLPTGAGGSTGEPAGLLATAGIGATIALGLGLGLGLAALLYFARRRGG